MYLWTYKSPIFRPAKKKCYTMILIIIVLKRKTFLKFILNFLVSLVQTSFVVILSMSVDWRFTVCTVCMHLPYQDQTCMHWVSCMFDPRLFSSPFSIFRISIHFVESLKIKRGSQTYLPRIYWRGHVCFLAKLISLRFK